MTLVAVTAVGSVGAHGLGIEPLAAALAAGGAPTSAIEPVAGIHRSGGARRARLASGVDLASRLTPAQARRMSPPARFAVVAARLAFEQAGLGAPPEGTHAATAVIVGTAFGPSSVTETLLRQVLAGGPETASPALFTESVASAAASQVAIAFGARGPSLAITQREASDLAAMIEGVRLLRTGAAERALVIVVEELTPLLHGALDRFRALARPDAEGRETARPFDLRRDGTIAAEGAAAVLLEPAVRALRRGARPLVTVAASARGFDPSATPTDWGTGAAPLAAALGRGLEGAGVAPGSIELVLSGASGSRRGDRLEAGVLRALFGARLPPVVAPKGATGEYGGAFLASALLAAGGRLRIPRAGFEHADPELGLVPAQEPPAAPRRSLVSALASGGASYWLALDACEPPPPRGV